jgi:chromate transporter
VSQPDVRPPFNSLAAAGIFLRLGLTSFGGPIAHLGYFRTEFVERRRWVSDERFAELIVICQFLPGPASSQVAFSIGLLRGGLLGGLIAAAGFTLPSAIVMIGFALGLQHLAGATTPGWLRGLQLAAVAVVAQAVWAMAQKLCFEQVRASLGFVAIVITAHVGGSSGQIVALVVGTALGLLLIQSGIQVPEDVLAPPQLLPPAIPLTLFGLLLFGLPWLAQVSHSIWLLTFSHFFRAGALVFGGGHVVLPLLHDAVVGSGWISDSNFLSGYGLAQAVPGPLFTFAGFLGAAGQPGGWRGGIWSLLAIFLPGWLLVLGVLPVWQRVSGNERVRAALAGANASVVGILAVAFYSPVFTNSVHAPTDFALAALLFGLLIVWKAPSWLIVVLAAILGQIFIRT